MKQVRKNNDLQERQTYVPARIKVINVTAQRAICQSGETEESTEGDTTDWF